MLYTEVFPEEAHPEFGSGLVFGNKLPKTGPRPGFGEYDSVNDNLKSISNFVVVLSSSFLF